MKRIIAICLCLIAVLSASAMTGKKEQKNKIKSTTVMQTVYDSGKPSTLKESYEEFDKNGNTVLYEEFDNNGNIVHKETYVYNSSGDVTEETYLDSSSGKNYKKTHKYTLIRDKTRESEESTFAPTGELTKKVVYTYNASGKKATETHFDAAGKITKKLAYGYNSNDMKLTKQSFSPAGVLENQKEWHYEYY